MTKRIIYRSFLKHVRCSSQFNMHKKTITKIVNYNVKMHDEEDMLIIKNKQRFCIPKNLNISHCWNTIGPIVAQEIGAPDYSPIPNYFDTNAYKIGYIFVPTSTQKKCFRSVPVLKILGPIHDFVVKSETNTKWLDKKFHSVRTSGDQMDFRIIFKNGKNQLSFTGRDYYFLSKAHDMLTQRNVTIDRTSHEDLLNITWIGLITHVVVTRISEFRIIKDLRERVLYIGENEHTILFKYEICTLDQHGVVIKSETKKIRCKWLPVGDKESESLPLIEFQSLSDKT
ncbi:PREDICTED: uncharacterized protein LOC108763745 [Trachymyrmex cornetzi]|uniref:uncharacterized protein LOC108763745 n=1 Tax=Trachymyrmex cornetzi TaxID=471704 RepID=UPI00084F72B6|nr:PREDICTED: uncharacterized protein LOC108763745 [Trachymyrmex cornetzi]